MGFNELPIKSAMTLDHKSYNPEISIVAPVFNEDGAIFEFYQRLKGVLDGLKRTYEIIFVDDGSKDKSFSIVHDACKKDPHVKVVKLRSNFGQTAGIAAGIDHASGSIIIPMDSDLQHAPEDIPLFLAKIDEGFDIVSGWRKKRVDGFILRRLPSKAANSLMRYISGIELHDFGTTFKAYRRDVIRQVRLYGQFHRFIPVLCAGIMKLKITEIPIQNIVRPIGQSNYGIWRTFTVFFDLLRLKFLMSFMNRPLQVFGTLGICLFFFSGLISLYILIERLQGITLVEMGPSIFILAVSFGLAGLQLLCIGLVAELIVKFHYEGHKKRPYVVDKIFGELTSPIFKWVD